MVRKIFREVSALEDINDATSERVLLWAQRVEAQSVQRGTLNSIKDIKEFGFVR